RYGGDAQALAEDAEGRVEREGGEEAVGAAVDAELAEVQHRLDRGGRRHRERGDRHRESGARLLAGLALGSWLLRDGLLELDGDRCAGRRVHQGKNGVACRFLTVRFRKSTAMGSSNPLVEG